MNQRQQNYLQKVINLANKMNDVYNESFELSQSFAEEFKSEMENSLDPVDGLVNEAELRQYGIDYNDISNMLLKPATQFVNFYTNQATLQQEYGKFIRRIKNT